MSLICSCRKLVPFQQFIRLSILKPFRTFHTLQKSNHRLFKNKSLPAEVRPPKRSYFWIFKRRTNREIRLVDNPPADYEIIYRCSFDNWLLGFQHLSLYSIVILSFLYLYKGVKTTETSDVPQSPPEKYQKNILGMVILSVQENEDVFFLTFYILLFCMFRLIMGRMPVRIYCHPDQGKYLMYFYEALPNQMKKVPLKAGDLVPKPGILHMIFKDDVYENKKTLAKYILLEQHFKVPADLYIMLGEQKYPEKSKKFDDEIDK